MKTRIRRALRHVLAALGQCDTCGGWFDGMNGGTCSACKKIGR